MHGARVSASLFPLLGVDAAIGRTFTADEDRTGAAKVVVISHELWTRRYGGEAGLVNRTIDLDGVAYTVIGVMPDELLFPTGKQLHALLSFGPRIDFWRPLALPADPSLIFPAAVNCCVAFSATLADAGVTCIAVNVGGLLDTVTLAVSAMVSPCRTAMTR